MKSQPAARPWPADQIERRAVKALAPYARNARTHSDEQVGQIVASIREWGWTSPVLIDETDTIIAGHGRVMAAERMGLADVPVIVARGWSEAQKRAYVVADNKIALNSGWDDDLLRMELGEIAALDFDLSLTGFDPGELSLPGDEPAAAPEAVAHGALAERFGIPPFSVLNAREGWWQDRKRAWLSLGIKSELGRGGEAAASFQNQDKLDAFRHEAIPGGAGKNAVYRSRANLGSGAIEPPGGQGGMVNGLLDRRAKQKAARKAHPVPGGGGGAYGNAGGRADPKYDKGKPTKNGGVPANLALGKRLTDQVGKAKNGKRKAAAFGQDLMRGEHKVGGGK
jgi:hypothetical protein